MKKIKTLLVGGASFFSFMVAKAMAFENPVVGGDLGGEGAAAMAAATTGETFVNYFVNIWQAFITIGAIMVLIYFLWGALEWITAGGDSSKVADARNRITQSMLGLIILVSSFVIIEFISGLFFGDEFSILNFEFETPDAGGASLEKYNFFSPPITYADTVEINIGEVAKDDFGLPGTEDYDPGAGEEGFGKLITRILTIAMVIGAVLVLINLIWAGIEWITSGGDSSKTESARNKITQSLIGLIVLASVVAIFALIQGFLGLEVFDFG